MNTSRALLLSGILALTASPVFAAANVGDKAPKIDAGAWFNLPKGMKSINPKHLKGQIVLLEFWATW
ncbi:MAG: hypothetical protein MI923_30730 [Phycisphaerales bacterium]|nr:hypothetical protein [Phycisphaerales bacterium]